MIVLANSGSTVARSVATLCKKYDLRSMRTTKNSLLLSRSFAHWIPARVKEETKVWHSLSMFKKEKPYRNHRQRLKRPVFSLYFLGIQWHPSFSSSSFQLKGHFFFLLFVSLLPIYSLRKNTLFFFASSFCLVFYILQHTLRTFFFCSVSGQDLMDVFNDRHWHLFQLSSLPVNLSVANDIGRWRIVVE